MFRLKHIQYFKVYNHRESMRLIKIKHRKGRTAPENHQIQQNATFANRDQNGLLKACRIVSNLQGDISPKQHTCQTLGRTVERVQLGGEGRISPEICPISLSLFGNGRRVYFVHIKVVINLNPTVCVCLQFTHSYSVPFKVGKLVIVMFETQKIVFGNSYSINSILFKSKNKYLIIVKIGCTQIQNSVYTKCNLGLTLSNSGINMQVKIPLHGWVQIQGYTLWSLS